MADTTVVHIAENSPEYVAYRLLVHVVHADGKTLGGGSRLATVDRKYILDTYAECLNAVQNPQGRPPA
jgi:hypothetical protein